MKHRDLEKLQYLRDEIEAYLYSMERAGEADTPLYKALYAVRAPLREHQWEIKAQTDTRPEPPPP